MPRSYTKIANKRDGVTLSYTTPQDTHTIKGFDAPRPEFDIALQQLGPYVIDILALPDDWAEALTVLGVTISDSDRGRGLTITALRDVDGLNCPMVINTPHIVEDEWPAGCMDALEVVQTEADRYIDGERAQMEIEIEEALPADYLLERCDAALSVSDA